MKGSEHVMELQIGGVDTDDSAVTILNYVRLLEGDILAALFPQKRKWQKGTFQSFILALCMTSGKKLQVFV